MPPGGWLQYRGYTTVLVLANLKGLSVSFGADGFTFGLHIFHVFVLYLFSLTRKSTSVSSQSRKRTQVEFFLRLIID